MTYKWIAAALLLTSWPALPARADDTLIGEATYWYGPIRLYDAELRAPSGQFDWQAPFELELTYNRDFKASDLARVSIREMKRMGFPIREAQLKDKLESCFADVADGDTITGQSVDEDTAKFFLNGAERCTITAPRFREAFFGIWLGEKARYRAAAKRLLGERG